MSANGHAQLPLSTPPTSHVPSSTHFTTKQGVSVSNRIETITDTVPPPPRDIPNVSSADLSTTHFIFDFDWTLINDDCEHFAVASLNVSIRAQMDEWYDAGMPWPDVVNKSFRMLYEGGVRKESFDGILKNLRMPESTVRMLSMLKGRNASLSILSDANTYFLESLLREHGLTGTFRDVMTNPASFNDDGQLIIRPYAQTPPECQVGTCSYNLCKGQEVRRLRQERKPMRVVYMGDGKNDYCPCLSLTEGDLIFARQGRALDPLLRKAQEQGTVKASIFWWSTSEELLQLVTNAFNLDVSSSSSTSRRRELMR